MAEILAWRPAGLFSFWQCGLSWVGCLADLFPAPSSGAIIHFQRAVRLVPGTANFQNNLGDALAAAGRVDEAVVHFKEAVRLQPDYAEAYNNLGVALVSQGKLHEAVGQFNEALRYQSTYGDAQRNREIVLLELEKQQREKRE